MLTTLREKLACGMALAGALAGVPGAAEAQDGAIALPVIDVVGSRLAAGITGTSTTVITAEDIARSPSQSLPDILSHEPGIQVTNPYGGVNGARSTVDMRGFGASASSNTLILIDGRRINDLDIVGVDLAAIPRESIERIEITRGNSGAVLYGDGAVGGVVNIVTKSPAGQGAKARFEGAFGSFNYREGSASASGSKGPWSANVFTNAINSDGYRVNNFYRQVNAVANARYTAAEGSFFVNLSADSSSLGLPGARRVDPVAGLNQLVTDRNGATTPYDSAEKKGQNLTLGFTRSFAPGAELIVDGGIRHKNERASFYLSTPTVPSADPSAAVDTSMTTVSFTPRVKLASTFGDMPWNATGGVDYYRAAYGSDRPLYLGAAPINRYDLTQSSIAAYWQQTVSVLPSTDISGGARVQRHHLEANGSFDVNAPGGQSCFGGFCFPNGVTPAPLDTSETNQAYHLGFEHRINPVVAVFGRVAQSFRVPNVDERVGMVSSGIGVPTNFQLRTQKSHDAEVGVRFKAGPLDLQTSVYDMRLTDEIHFRYGPAFEANNINLDPTRRYGSETIASYRVNDAVRLKGGFAYTRSVFREGLFAGNDVPLVSRWTGNAGVSWEIWQKALVMDTTVRYVGSRRMDNDQSNVQPLIPASTIVDLKFSGEYQQYFWSVAVLNVFNVDYYDYAIASPFPYGFASQLNTYNAYPMPGRSIMFRAGINFL
jgi:iron complex outermembrane receptor protein